MEDKEKPTIEDWDRAFRKAAFTAAMRKCILSFPRNTIDQSGKRWGNITFRFHPDGKVTAVQDVYWHSSRQAWGQATLNHAVPKELHAEFRYKREQLEKLGFGTEDVEEK